MKNYKICKPSLILDNTKQSCHYKVTSGEPRLAERRIISRPMEPEPDNAGVGKVSHQYNQTIPISTSIPSPER